MGVVRNTKAIEELTSLFLDDEKALSVVEIVNILSSKMNKTTVYRALKRLEDDEVIHSFMDRDGLKCYAKIEIQIKKRFILIFIVSLVVPQFVYHLNLKSLSIKIIKLNLLKFCYMGSATNVFNTAIKIVLVKI